MPSRFEQDDCDDGAEISYNSLMRLCPTCGAAIAKNAKVCPKCGERKLNPSAMPTALFRLKTHCLLKWGADGITLIGAGVFFILALIGAVFFLPESAYSEFRRVLPCDESYYFERQAVDLEMVYNGGGSLILGYDREAGARLGINSIYAQFNSEEIDKLVKIVIDEREVQHERSGSVFDNGLSYMHIHDQTEIDRILASLLNAKSITFYNANTVTFEGVLEGKTVSIDLTEAASPQIGPEFALCVDRQRPWGWWRELIRGVGFGNPWAND